MLTSEQLSQLASEAGQVGAAGDAAAAAKLLAVLTGAEDSDFAGLDLDDLKNVMQVAALLADLADSRTIGCLFVRCINAMQALDETPAPAEFILPLYNLRTSYAVSGATEQANQLLGQIVEVTRQADIVSRETIRALMELLPAFENGGYTEAAVVLYRPICNTIAVNAEVDWDTKLQVVARFGRLQLADGKPADAVQTYEQALAFLDEAETGSNGDVGNTRMMLWNLIVEAKSRTDDPGSAEQAYEMAKSLAEASDNPESREAGVTYHNLAGFWLNRSQRDRYAEGVALTQRALAIADRLGNRQTSEYAGGLGQIANFKAGLGETEEAERYYDACFEAFAAAADTNASDVADYRDDEGKFRLEAEQPGCAVLSFAAAREIRNAIPEFPRDKLADTDAWTGVALFEDGDFAESSKAFRRALDFLMNEPTEDATSGE